MNRTDQGLDEDVTVSYQLSMGAWAVVGVDSGTVYTTWSDKTDALREAAKKNEDRGVFVE